MKRVLFYILTFVSLFFLSASPASAMVISKQQGAVVVGEDEVIDDDLFIGAQTVDIDGTVNGDVYVGAETVRVNGTINGDLHAGAAYVYVSGTVEDDAYIGAGNVSLTAALIGDSLLVGAGTLYIDEDSVIGGSLISGAGDLSNYALVGRNVIVGAGNANLNSEVGGEVRVGSESLTVGPNSVIGKDLYYMTDKNGSVNISQSASVSGMTKMVEPPQNYQRDFEMGRSEFRKFVSAGRFGLRIVSYLGALIIGFLCLKFFKKSFDEKDKVLRVKFFKSLGVGFLVSMLVFPAFVILAITGVGLPLAVLGLVAFFVGVYFSKVVFGYFVGNWFSSKMGWKNTSPYISFALGLVVVYVLKSVPKIGFLASLTIGWSGLGAIILYHKSNFSK